MTNRDRYFAHRSYLPEKGSIMEAAAVGSSIFDLKAKDEDFTPTVDLTREINGFLASSKEMADTITTNYDAKRRAEKEAKGQAWQNSRRGTKQATKDRRAAGEAPLRESFLRRAFLTLLISEEVVSPAQLAGLTLTQEALSEELHGLVIEPKSKEELEALLEATNENHSDLLQKITIDERNPLQWARDEARGLYAHLIAQEAK